MNKVLLIDLEPSSSIHIQKKVNWSYYNFVIEDIPKNFSESLLAINTSEYDFYILNLSSLDSNGLELCKQIRKYNSKPIILLGGKKDFNLVRKAMNLQVNDYIPHPIETKELIHSLLTIKQYIQEQRNRANTKTLHDQNIQKYETTSDIIDSVKEYVEQSIHENITLKKISDDLHYNSSYLGQKFKCDENMSFNQYLLKRRMERAQFLLRYTKMKIYQIAEEVGYSDLDWFYKKFKSHTGVSASVYRTQISEYKETQLG